MMSGSVARPVVALAILSAAHAFAPAVPVAGSRPALALQTGQRGGGVTLPARRPRAQALQSQRLALRMQSKDEGEGALDRFVACLPYALPLADSFEWGHYLFDSYPLLAIPFLPLFPVIQLLNLPFVSFGIFIVLFSFVARNPTFSRLVRFNTLQAVYLDVVLIFPQLLRSVVGPTNQFIPSGLAETGANTVFYAILFSCIYSCLQNAAGKTPNEIPVISEAVESQMPF